MRYIKEYGLASKYDLYNQSDSVSRNKCKTLDSESNQRKQPIPYDWYTIKFTFVDGKI
jgi:hypothetical protein